MASVAPEDLFAGPLTETTDLAAVLDHVPAVIDLLDLNLVHRFANWANTFWYGRRPHEIVGLHARDLLGPAQYAEARPYLDAVREGVPQAFERTVMTTTGERRYTVANYEPYLVDGEVAGVLILSSDVTGRVRADVARRELALRVADIGQQEQAAAETERIALTRLDVMAAEIAAVAAADGQCRELLLGVAHDVADAARSLRLVRAGRPDPNAGGPEATIRARLDADAQALGLRSELVVLGVLDGLDESRTGLVLQVLDETLSNVARHADAGRVDVTVSLEERDLVVVVADDGRGVVRARPGSGLDRLRHLAITHGGRCSWVINDGDGTSVEWRVPVTPVTASEAEANNRHAVVPDPASARGVRLPPPDYRTPETIGLDADELRAVLDQVPIGLTVWDRDVRNRYANRTAARWMKMPDPAAMLGRRFDEMMPPGVPLRVAPLAKAALAGTHTLVERAFGPVEGVPNHIRTEYLPRRVDGRVEGLYVQVSDISERRHAESAVQADAERMSLVKARHQADEDVHHLAIQQLFAAVLRLDTAHASCDPACQAALDAAMAPFDETIAALRHSVVVAD